MPEVIKDNRKWYITLPMQHTECPHLFYPRNVHGCYILRDDEGFEDECNMDRCPLRTDRLSNPSQPGGAA